VSDGVANQVEGCRVSQAGRSWNRALRSRARDEQRRGDHPILRCKDSPAVSAPRLTPDYSACAQAKRQPATAARQRAAHALGCACAICSPRADPGCDRLIRRAQASHYNHAVHAATTA
jgi:hypothetical protein